MAATKGILDDAARDALEREIVEALRPVVEKWGIDVSVLVHPDGRERGSDGLPARGPLEKSVFFFRR